MGSESPRHPGVSRRALAVGFLLTPLNVLFITGQTWLIEDFTGWHSLFTNTLTIIFVLALVNRSLRRRRPALAFSVGEMLTVYVLLAVSTGLVSVVWDMGGALAGIISYPFWFASSSNGWADLLWPCLPEWLTVRTHSVLEGFYVGDSSAYRWAIVKAWARPAFWWTTFVSALMWVCLCLNSVVRRRWADEEKLPFPMAMAPIQIADERFGLLRSKLFWAAVVVCLTLEAWNAAGAYIPSLPRIPLYYRFFQYVANRPPWDSIPFPVMTLSPWAFGLIYLIPLDMTFSLFFFDMLWNVEYVVSAWFGWNTQGLHHGFPYGQQQSAGGLLAIIAAFLWLDRRYFLQVIRRALSPRSALGDEHQEALSYRAALLGALAGAAYLWWFLSRAGMSRWVVPGFLVLYFAIALAISRLRAQVGPPSHSLAGMMPNSFLITTLGTRALGARTMGVLGLLDPYLGMQGNNPTPIQLEALKMAEGGRLERRRIAIAMALVVPLTVLCYFWVSIHYAYQLGMGTGKVNREVVMSARYVITDMDAAIRYPGDPNVPTSLAMGFGFAFALVLMHLKLRFTWWPLHPAAFPLCLNWISEEFMLPLFIVWVFKVLLLRYGGLRAHRTAVPLFLGLLVGTAVATVVHGGMFRIFGLRW